MRGGTASKDLDFGKTEREIFFAAGLDRGDPFEAACKMSFLAQAVLGVNRALIGGNGHADRRSAPAIAQVSRPSGSWLEPERLPDVAASDDGLGLMRRIDAR